MRADSVKAKEEAEKLRQEGNQLFSKAKFSAAIERYTEAILLCDKIPALYVNRALCHKKRGSEPSRWAEDAERALELERGNLKANYLLGSACLEMGQYEKAIAHLQKALESAREHNATIKDDIWHELAKAKFAQWERDSAARKDQRRALRQQLDRWLAADEQVAGSQRGAWDALFTAGSRHDVPSEVPSVYTCPLTMEVFREPVITPAGHSYERSALLEHLRKVGPWDPISRDIKVTEKDLVLNAGLRAAVAHYLDTHPYAWGECT